MFVVVSVEAVAVVDDDVAFVDDAAAAAAAAANDVAPDADLSLRSNRRIGEGDFGADDDDDDTVVVVVVVVANGEPASMFKYKRDK